MPSVLSSPLGGLHWTQSLSSLGVTTLLPSGGPTQTVLRGYGSRSADPDCRIHWRRYRTSPPATSRASVSRTQGTQRSSSRLGSAVSSSAPKDLHPNPHIGR